MRKLQFWLIALLLGACYSPERLDCRVRCSEAGRCSAGMVCSHGFCGANSRSCAPAVVTEEPRKVLSCRTGERRCVSESASEFCLESGEWQLEEPSCSGVQGTCWRGTCVECAPGSTGCDRDGNLLRCGEEGRWLPPVACAESGHVCKVASCAPMFEVHAGGAHACTLDASGSVRCWGAGARGQLGLGDSGNRGDSDGAEPGVVDLGGPALALATGGSHTCAILSQPGRLPNRVLKCWGDNGAGQLGLGDRQARGDGPGEMGLDLPDVELGSDWGPVALALGSRHSCALFAHGGVKCWGENGLAQLGLSDTSSRGGNSEDMGKNLPFIDFGDDFPVAIAAGANLTCAAFASGVAKCWGQSLAPTVDPLADVTPFANALPVAISDGPFQLSAGNRHACALTGDGNVLCWGSLNAGQVGSLDPEGTLQPVDLGPRGASSISAGAEHTCAMVDGRLKCWGLNVFGELGLPETAPAAGAGSDGSDVEQGLPFLDLGADSGSPLVVTDVSLGVHFSCAAIEHRTVECWGANHSGQLGYQP